MCQCGLAVSRRCGDVGQQCFVYNAWPRRHVRVCASGSSESDVISRQRRTCLNLSVARVFLADSLVVSHVEFPTFLSFESETCRASVVWETRG